MGAPTGEHEQKLTIQVDVFIPDHPDRTESGIFRAARNKLIANNPAAKCWVDLGCEGDLELHHFHVEWCDADGVDWERMKVLHPAFDWTTFDPAHPETFIDSAYNASLVLCRKHHIGKDHGIHFLPYPTWLMQRNRRPDFVFSPDEEVGAAPSVPTPAATSSS